MTQNNSTGDNTTAPETTPKAAKPLPSCLCGCGAHTAGGSFRPGHDARWHATLTKLSRGDAKLDDLEPTLRANIERLCALEDGKPTKDHDGTPWRAAERKAKPASKTAQAKDALAKLRSLLEALAGSDGIGEFEAALAQVEAAL